MKYEAPDLLLLQWLQELGQNQQEVLALRYVFMSSVDSAEFAFTGPEALQHFIKLLAEPEFPLRRVARLLSIRGVFTFLLDTLSLGVLSEVSCLPESNNLHSLESAKFLRGRQHWQQLCQTGLSDSALQDWLLILQDEIQL